jgi:hypothetical protein
MKSIVRILLAIGFFLSGNYLFAADLYVADEGIGYIYKYTPIDMQT